MKKLSHSKNKLDRQRRLYADKLDTGAITSNRIDEIFKIFEDDMAARLIKEEKPEFQENNLEYDLRTTEWILEKARTNEAYAQNLYSALCNNYFFKQNIEDTPENILKILTEGQKYWSCSWRYAGGIIADMRQEGDYLDWYCSGIRNTDYDGEANSSWDGRNYVSEGVITEEILNDLKKLGWLTVDTPNME